MTWVFLDPPTDTRRMSAMMSIRLRCMKLNSFSTWTKRDTKKCIYVLQIFIFVIDISLYLNLKDKKHTIKESIE